KMVAYVGVAPLAGAYAHKLPRKPLLVALDLGRAVSIALIPFVTEIWQIYVLIFALSACSAGFTPTFQATIPDVLPDDARYTRALSLSRLAYDLENLISPMLAAVALTFLSYNALFTVNAASFLISAMLVLSVTLPVAQTPERDSERSLLTHGMRVYLRTPRLRALLALSMAAAMGGAMVIINTVVYIREHLGGSETDTAIAFAAYGAGSMAVALALPRVLDVQPDRPFMLAGAALLGLGLLLGLANPGYYSLMAIWVLLGCGSSLIQTPSARLLKRSAHEGDRPAVYAAHFSLSHACWLVAYLIAGWIGGLLGLMTVFLVFGIGTIVFAVTAAAIWKAPDVQQLVHRHEATEHNHEHVHDEHHQHPHDGSEGPEPHRHAHTHEPVEHRHDFVIDLHHGNWPSRG
ncbi:MAG: MFS transporter, partial [Gammaproteobacteria bacterium]|nr:MFS transporter [Gammaproteobacteria bacterium]